MLKRAEREIAKLKRKGALAKKLAASSAVQLAKLKASLKKTRAKKGSKSSRDRVTKAAKGVASKARRAAKATPDEKSASWGKARNYEGPEVPLSPQSFPEGRLFRSGAAVLGFFEGRPGIQGIRSVTPLLPPVGALRIDPTTGKVTDVVTRSDRIATADVTARIEAIIDDWGGDGTDEDGEPDHGNTEALLWDAYWEAEEFGAAVEVDVESDSGGGAE